MLGLIFLKYISDAFEAKHAELDAQRAQGAEPEDPDEYRGVNIFWVPPEARWAYLKSMAAADHRSARRRHHERDNAALGLVADLVTYLAKAMIR